MPEQVELNKEFLKTEKYNCPNCGKWPSEKDIVFKEKPFFNEYPYPHHSWDEYIVCPNCETKYKYENGT